MSDAPAPKPYAYHLSYSLRAHPEGISKEQVQAEGVGGTVVGGCDALFVTSILFPPDGSYSALFGGLDGRTGKELDDHEWFKVWMFLAKRLSESKTLDEGRKDIAGITYEMLSQALFGSPPTDCMDPECTVVHAKPEGT